MKSRMTDRGRAGATTLAGLAAVGLAGFWAFGDDPHAGGAGEKKWKVHDMERPKPPVVTPGTASTQEQPGKPPSDAVVLFDGKDLSQWQGGNWKVQNGEMIVGGGTLTTKQAFGDCQLHVEWAAPAPPKGEGQGRGNSGVFLMGKYEVQVLDSYQSDTYADGQAAALYGQYPPLVNATRPPGEWQTYDIIFHRPRFGAGGKVEKPGTVTVLHNGVLVQDHAVLEGASTHKVEATYAAHPDKLPITLQDHGNPVRYRNLWIRPLEKDASADAGAPKSEK